jgi:hypothetical protein
MTPIMKIARQADDTYWALDKLAGVTRTCHLCGNPITVYIVKEPELRVTVGCRECSVFEDEQGKMRHYIGDITYLTP